MIKQGYKKKIIVTFSPTIFRIYKLKNRNAEFKKREYFVEYFNRNNEITPNIIYNKPFFYNQLQKVRDDEPDILIRPSTLNKL